MMGAPAGAPRGREQEPPPSGSHLMMGAPAGAPRRVMVPGPAPGPLHLAMLARARSDATAGLGMRLA
jgi:hypothetical protein